MSLGSEIRKKPIPDPGSRGQKITGSRIRICNTAFNNIFCFLFLKTLMSSYPGSQHLHGYFTLTDLKAFEAVKF
jgi:hypothetical protein